MKVERWSDRTVVYFSYAGGVIMASVDDKDGVSNCRVTAKHPNFGIASLGSVEQAIFWIDTLSKQTQGELPV